MTLLLELELSDLQSENITPQPTVLVETIPIQKKNEENLSSATNPTLEDAVIGVLGKTWYIAPSPKSSIGSAVKIKQREFVVDNTGLPEVLMTQWEIQSSHTTVPGTTVVIWYCIRC